jgi:D-3-phosphoglycerate dehydrogenase / 2-oxoglutarate reductase
MDEAAAAARSTRANRFKVLVPDDYGARVRDLDCVRRYPQLELEFVPGPAVDRARFSARLAGADALILIRERSYIDAELLGAAPRLKIVSQLGKVRRNLSIDECTQRGIAVAEGPTVSHGTAELTWALILASRRCVPQEAAALREGRWQSTMGWMVRGQTLGIWGYGRVGRIIAGYATAFGMRVLVWGRANSLAGAREDGLATAASRDALFAEADVVSVHVRLTPETAGSITAGDLARMKPSALLVNTARAELVAPGALASALSAGRPGYAVVDVFEAEPVGTLDHPLLRMSNVICMPHMGYVNWQEYEILFGDALESIAKFFAGTPQNIANPGALAQ